MKPVEAVSGKQPQKASKTKNVVQPKLLRTGGASSTQQLKKQQIAKGSLPKLSKTKTASQSVAVPKGKRTVQGSAASHGKGMTPPPPGSPAQGKPSSPRKAAPSQSQTNSHGKSKSPPVLKPQSRQVVTPRRDLKSLKTDKASVIKQTLESKRKAAGIRVGAGKKPGLGKATLPVSGGMGKPKGAPKGSIKKAAVAAEKTKTSTSSQKSKAKQNTLTDETKGTWWLPSVVQRFVQPFLSWSRGKLSRQTVKSVSPSHDDCR